MSAPFTHLDPGTDEDIWATHLDANPPGPFDPDVDTLLIVVAHPDDETLAAAGIMARVAGRGGRVEVVIASDGEGSHPNSPTYTPQDLARLRRAESERAAHAVAPEARTHFLGIPDGELEAHRVQFQASLDDIAAELGDLVRVLVVSTWTGDGHRDHRIAGEAAEQTAARFGFALAAAPVWAWHWGTPDDLPWDRIVGLRLRLDEMAAKRRAIACHVSQVEPLSPASGDEAVVHERMRSHFERDTELFITVAPHAAEPAPAAGSLGAEWFDEFYERNGDDPWGFETRWYEERKRSVLLASLPTQHLGAVLEIGCATGILTEQLADRAARVVAIDAAAPAVHLARRRLHGRETVTVLQGVVPDAWPSGRFDTIVISEVGYYLVPDDLDRVIAQVDAALSSHGTLVACHWRHPVAEYPQTGDAVHAALRAVPGWERLALHEERDFVLELFARTPASSVAEREGLV